MLYFYFFFNHFSVFFDLFYLGFFLSLILVCSFCFPFSQAGGVVEGGLFRSCPVNQAMSSLTAISCPAALICSIDIKTQCNTDRVNDSCDLESEYR